MKIDRSRGFTLIEMLIGLAIVGFLAMGAMPSYSAWMQNMQTRSTAESILNGMQLARAEALRRNNNVQLVLAGTAWTATLARSGEQIQARPAAEGSATTTVVTTPADSTTVTFNSLGRVVPNIDGSPSITQIDVGSAILTAPEGRGLRTTVGLGGSIRMCDTQAPAGDPRGCV